MENQKKYEFQIENPFDSEVINVQFSEEELECLKMTNNLEERKMVVKKALSNLKETITTTEYYYPPQSAEEFKASFADLNYARKLALYGMPGNGSLNQNLMLIENHGGILNEGVCWWHSRFQRAALYLTYYAPQKNKPTKHKAQKIIKKLMACKEVVEIPGFNCFSLFSKAFEKEIQHCLESTQIFEGIFLFSWINGLKGVSETTPDEMRKKMDKIYQEVKENGIAYLKLQSPGISSHAWLVCDMELVNKDDVIYKLSYLDSNYPWSCLSWDYNVKATNIIIYSDTSSTDYGVPYLERTFELQKIKKIVEDFCKT